MLALDEFSAKECDMPVSIMSDTCSAHSGMKRTDLYSTGSDYRLKFNKQWEPRNNSDFHATAQVPRLFGGRPSIQRSLALRHNRKLKSWRNKCIWMCEKAISHNDGRKSGRNFPNHLQVYAEDMSNTSYLLFVPPYLVWGRI